MELPEVTFFSNFYFGFNTENKLRNVYYKETDNGLKHSASLYFPFYEKFGLMLLKFLNADLSNYEIANKLSFMFMVLRY